MIELNWKQTDPPFEEHYRVTVDYLMREVEMRVWYNGKYIHGYMLTPGQARKMGEALIAEAART